MDTVELKEMIALFDRLFNIFTEQEKNIYEAYNDYQQNPNETLSKTIINDCIVGRELIQMLLNLIPKIYGNSEVKQIKESMEETLSSKYQDLREISGELLFRRTK